MSVESYNFTYEKGKQMKKTQYFIQTDAYGVPFSYWRRIWRDGVSSEECWQKSKNIWFPCQGRLLWMQISGECTLQEVSEDYAMALVPEAFES